VSRAIRLLPTATAASLLAACAAFGPAADALAQTAGATASGARSQEGQRYEFLVPGILFRPVFGALDPGRRYRAHVWSLFVGPRQKSEEATLPGSAVLVVYAGRGLLSVNSGNIREVSLGQTFVLGPNDRFRIENPSEHQSISLRTIIISPIPRESPP
jgi:mannose-6-phosphate isomerase-like protein (cupin superfamily)